MTMLWFPIFVSGVMGLVLMATASLGAVAYSTVNSPGYYADRGNRAVVVMFGVLTVLSVSAIAVLFVD